MTLFIIVVSITAYSQKEKKTCQSVGPDEFYLLLHSNTDAVLIDVNPVDEYEEMHIEGAISAPDKKTLFGIIDTLGVNNPILLCCTYGNRSEEVCNLIHKRKFPNPVYNLDGGLEDWERRGFDLVKPD